MNKVAPYYAVTGPRLVPIQNKLTLVGCGVLLCTLRSRLTFNVGDAGFGSNIVKHRAIHLCPWGAELSGVHTCGIFCSMYSEQPGEREQKCHSAQC